VRDLQLFDCIFLGKGLRGFSNVCGFRFGLSVVGALKLGYEVLSVRRKKCLRTDRRFPPAFLDGFVY